MDPDLYDEFGNYIGPDIEEEEEFVRGLPFPSISFFSYA